MSLTSPKIPYNTIRDALITLFQNNKTALNVGLTSPGGTFTNNAQIVSGDPRIVPIPDTVYPVIMVKISRKTEEFIALGNSGRKRPVVRFYIFALTMDLAGTPDTEIMTLVGNIEGILRDNIKFDSNIEYSDLGDADWGYGVGENETYVNAVQISLNCYLEVK